MSIINPIGGSAGLFAGRCGCVCSPSDTWSKVDSTGFNNSACNANCSSSKVDKGNWSKATNHS